MAMKKSLIIGLIIGIVLIGGLWIWKASQQEISEPCKEVKFTIGAKSESREDKEKACFMGLESQSIDKYYECNLTETEVEHVTTRGPVISCTFSCCIKQEGQELTLIEITGTVEPDPTYVSLPVTLPIDTKEEALILAKACGDITMDEYTEIRQTKKGWYIGRTTPNFSDFGITIDKDTGKTECIFYG